MNVTCQISQNGVNVVAEVGVVVVVDVDSVELQTNTLVLVEQLMTTFLKAKAKKIQFG